jgi:hypothetical protein
VARPIALLLGASLLILSTPLPARAAAVRVLDGPVRVSANTIDSSGTDGFAPLVVELESLRMKPQVVSLSFESMPWARVSARVQVAPGERRRFTMLVPVFARHGQLHARIEGTDLSDSQGFTWQWSKYVPLLLEGRTAGAPLLHQPVKDGKEREEGEETEEPRLALDAGELPETLAGYVGLAAVALLETPFDRLPEPQRRALEAYVLTGGTLYARRDAGSGPVLASLGGDEVSPGRHGAGFGQVVVCEQDCAAELHERAPVEAIVRPSVSEDPERYSAPFRSRSFPPLLDVANAPAGGFLVLVLLFAAVIGPGSFFVRRRYGPPALIAFIPAVALIACLGIGLFGLLREGLFTIHASSRTLTLLDSARNRAATLSIDAHYATLAPGEVRFAALEAPALGMREGLALDETDGLVFTKGLIPSRSYREMLTCSVSTTRARLSLRREGEKLLVDNALGAAVTRGTVVDEGRECAFEQLPDGGSVEARCKPISCGEERASCGSVTPNGFFEGSADRFGEAQLQQVMLAPLTEGQFVAELDRAVFAPTGGLKVERQGDRQLVRGEVAP